MAGASTAVRRVMGALVLDPRAAAAQVPAVFIDEFGQKPDVESGQLAVIASHAVEGARASLWSHDPPIFWNARQDAYARINNAADLEAIAPSVRAGAAWPALDDCVVFQDRHGVLLFASGAGATTLYHTEQNGVLLFASRPQSIRAARSAAVDRLGLGEIVRFGANYGRRTLLQNVHRIPIGHVLDCAPGQPPALRAFMDYSYQPQARLDETAMREAIGAALSRNLALIEGPRDLLFSGGVDSALLGLRGIADGTVKSAWFYAVSQDDPERAIAHNAAETIGLDLHVVQDSTSPEDIVRRIGSYALPTLDFSIIPTHALGAAAVHARGRTTFIDGTGGDAWFGFGSLAHATAWKSLNRLRAFSPLARRLYRAALPLEKQGVLRPLKGLARTPVLSSASLGHMCANPTYSALLDLQAGEWLTIEQEVLDVMRSLTGGELGGAAGEVIVSDACLIAVAQFAAKTSQWDVAEKAATVYPFLMPNMVALGRTMPQNMLIRDGTPKPLLKDIVAASDLGREFAYRRKSGFQPPLQRLLQGGDGREVFFAGSLEAPWTSVARQLPERLLCDGNSLRIGGLYAIWAPLVVEFWLKSLRQSGE